MSGHVFPRRLARIVFGCFCIIILAHPLPENSHFFASFDNRETYVYFFSDDSRDRLSEPHLPLGFDEEELLAVW